VSTTSPRELAHRHRNGIEISLLWDAVTDQLCLQVVDALEGRTLSLPLAPESALDAFYHPHAYAAA
jgi:hypothetical protein